MLGTARRSPALVIVIGALVGAAVAAAVVTALPPVLHVGPKADAAALKDRPNVVLILTDDMRADEVRYLPAVRRLQRSGVTFTEAISADSICCPARATLLTGKLAHNHLTIGNNVATHGGYQTFAAHNDVDDLLPQWLDDRGYRTALIGKYMNGVNGDRHFRQPDWTYFAPAVKHVYDYWDNGFSINGHYRHVQGYREVYLRKLLLARVRAWAPGDRPFFVYYSTLAPHKQEHAPGRGNYPSMKGSRSRAEVAADRFVVRPSVGETDLSDKPRWLQEWAANQPAPKPYPARLERHRIGSLMSVNQTITDLERTLRREHELENTVVILTSDNGFMLREHDLIDKNKAYRESINVPLVVRGPGFRGGLRMGQTVSLADVTATTTRLAGVVESHGADGLPLQDAIADPARFARRPVVIEGSAAQYPHAGQLPTDDIGRFYTGAVWGPYSLVHYETGDWEFYDRTTDPWQLHNTYTAHPAAGSPQALLQEWFYAHADCAGSSCNDPVG